ncbi:hypothetical protein AKJ16_DCAP14408 [Drosera capensis]
MSDAPFVPREKLIEKQKYFQSIQKHTYLKGRNDKITSVAIPVALAASSLFLILSLSNTSVLKLRSLSPFQSPLSATYSLQCRMSEAPFVPREKLIEKQKYFQSIQKHTYLKGRYDKITSVAIPAALAASSLFLIGRGIYNMSHGIGKKE